ncbi:hypothetical protein ACFQ61_07285 [Streptomyces sp. NPDC056500]|uniref:hypothetical protein n=1 Tax=Streptomyces sp. NPDC056500 TaxID=3345840 RepID=UPI0036C1022E
MTALAGAWLSSRTGGSTTGPGTAGRFDDKSVQSHDVQGLRWAGAEQAKGRADHRQRSEGHSGTQDRYPPRADGMPSRTHHAADRFDGIPRNPCRSRTA